MCMQGVPVPVFPETTMTDQQRNLSESDIFQLLEQANQQYEEYVRLTEIPDFTEQPEKTQPLYS